MDKLTIDSPMIVEIKSLLGSARKNVAQQVNTELLTTYWQIGRIIASCFPFQTIVNAAFMRRSALHPAGLFVN